MNKLISSNFEGFYDFTTRIQLPGSQDMVMFRGQDHSFWHDDPTQDNMKERYDRRIERFGRIDAQQQPVLFVRSCAASSELAECATLSRLLIEKFGRLAHLLLVIDFQGDDACGACVVDNMPNVMLHFLDTTKENATAPYGKAVITALDWVIQRPVAIHRMATLEVAVSIVKPTAWGLHGTGAVVAFDSAIKEFE